MKNLNVLFRNRIGIQPNEEITFGNIDKVLEKTAFAIPFENLCIIENRTADISVKNIANKILERNEGGLCYELNSLLYLFLLENGFHVTLVRGTVYNGIKQSWSATGKTHVAIVMSHNYQLYLVDTGFGGNLPLKPVPLTGEIVVSHNGEFRVDCVDSEHGDYVFYMKLKDKDEDWKVGYAFHSKESFEDITVLNEIQNIITHHPESAFNKKPLITKLTDKGNMTLTETSFVEWANGKMKKENIDKNHFDKLRTDRFCL